MVIWPWPWNFKVKFWKCFISGMGGLMDMEWKGCEWMGYYTHFVTFNLDLDLDLGFSRSNFEKVLSQEWDGRLTWNERDVSRYNVGHMLWLSTFTSPMTLALDFQGQILKMLYLRNGMADWHGTKGMWVDRMLHPLFNFHFDLNHDHDLGFSRSNFENAISQEWDGRLTWNERHVSR